MLIDGKRTYYPYRSDRPDKKYYIITDKGKKVYFGASGYEDFTQHGDKERKRLYLARHRSREDWGDKDTAGFWSRWLLWNKGTVGASYDDIRRRLGV
jgi:hypothetical protein